VVAANALGVFARLLLLDAQQFSQLFAAAAAAGLRPPRPPLAQQQGQGQQQGASAPE
jgi:hypothetical protein